MKIQVIIDEKISSEELIIKCNLTASEIDKIKCLVKSTLEDNKLILYKNREEYYMSTSEILFFETSGVLVYAHTINDAFVVKHKLYELESLLSPNFMRVSKSAIININHVSSINKSITSSSLVEFYHTHKSVYTSRMYLKVLCEKMKERRNFI